ncbi:MAG TPA: histone deacetylase [Solirubrobacteraceae bacterium]|nr:histone deacetylase [Solirubrobacteraceae bacterium]
MLYLHHPASLQHDPRALSPDHPDAPQRLEAIEDAIAGARLDGLKRRRAAAASEAELALVHSESHIAFVRDLCRAGGGQIDADTFVGEASYEAALHAAGGACEMARALMTEPDRTAFCAVRPAGHHADRRQAMGFCLFNNIAIAAQLAITELGVEKVMIIDWDVHHGNGTAEIFRRRADVVVASIHQAGLFPGTGALLDAGSGDGHGYTVNLPVPPGSGAEVWLSLIEHLVVPIGLEYRPELVLVSAGFDAHVADPLADCRLEAADFGQMACHVRDLAGALASPLGAVLEGGYQPHALGESVVATAAALLGEGEAESAAPDQIVTPRAASHLGHRWAL